MRVLIDECILRKFKLCLTPYDCQTVPEAGLAGKKNGELISLAEGRFDVLLTLDKGLEFQQNLTGRKIAIVPSAPDPTAWRTFNNTLPLAWQLLSQSNRGSCSGLDSCCSRESRE